jgi:hypothetical protein
MSEMRNFYEILVRKPQGARLLGYVSLDGTKILQNDP